jgi:hypothetical protein
MSLTKKDEEVLQYGREALIDGGFVLVYKREESGDKGVRITSWMSSNKVHRIDIMGMLIALAEKMKMDEVLRWGGGKVDS